MAQVIEFPGNPRPRLMQREPALVLILPVVRIEYEDGPRAKRRQAWYDLKNRFAFARRFGVSPENVHFGLDLGSENGDA